MRFCFYKRKERIRDMFKPFQSVKIDFNETFFGRGYKTKITCSPELKGEADKIIRLISEAAEERGSKSPFALSKRVEEELPEYFIWVDGIETEFAKNIFKNKFDDIGITSDGWGDYKLLED
jgi:hypothetical protein